MGSRMTEFARPTRSLLPELVKLDDHIADDGSFESAYMRALGAIACADGSVTLPEFAAITDVARQSENPALASVLLIYSADQPLPLDAALASLARASASQLIATRKAAFEAAGPLLALQGGRSRALADKLAKALSIALVPQELAAFESKEEQGVWDTLSRRARQLLRNRNIVDVAEEFRRTTGDPAITTEIRAYERGAINGAALRQRLIEASEHFDEALVDYQDRLASLQDIGQSAMRLTENAQAFIKQVGQRLAVIEARIQFERRAFTEDIDEAVHDAGNTVELQITQRLKHNDWTDAKVWEDIGRDELARTLERRVDRMVRRREEVLGLLQDDLRLFQEEMRHARASLVEPRHHASLAGLMPALRTRTRIANSADMVASVAIGTSTLGVLGAGAGSYFLGAAAVWPVVAPIVPIVGGAIIVATAFKLLTDADKRKNAEISSKRIAFEKAMRGKLDEAFASFSQQLESVGDGFRKTAEQMLRPLTLEADAALRLAEIQGSTADRLIAESSRAIKRLPYELAQAIER